MRTETLNRANFVRVRQAELKRELRQGALPLAGALIHPFLQRLRVYDVLCCLPVRGGGTDRGASRRASALAGDLFDQLQVSPLSRLQDLTDRQRRVLAALYHDMTGRS
jgi:hypothetical protein